MDTALSAQFTVNLRIMISGVLECPWTGGKISSTVGTDTESHHEPKYT